MKMTHITVIVSSFFSLGLLINSYAANKSVDKYPLSGTHPWYVSGGSQYTFAETNHYNRMQTPVPGASLVPNKAISMNDNSFSFSGALGYHWQFAKLDVRTEVQYKHIGSFVNHTDGFFIYPAGIDSTNSFKSKIDANTVMANIYLDHAFTARISGYVMAGLGLGFVKAQGTLSDSLAEAPTSSDAKRRINFAWQFGLGASYQLTKNWYMDLGADYLGLGKADFGRYYVNPPVSDGIGITANNLHVYQANLGLRYQF